MSRRTFLKASAAVGTAALLGPVGGHRVHAQTSGEVRPQRIILGGHANETTSFAHGLRVIGNRLVERFGDRIELRYLFNVEDIGYVHEDLLWLVDSRLMTAAYATQLSVGVPALDVATLPFLFADTVEARSAMDGALGDAAIETIEAQTDFRVLGFFENGFRHVSNSVRPIRSPDDLSGLSIRVFPTQQSTFRLLGADARDVHISETIPMLADGTVDGQENPFENIVIYGAHLHQRYYTVTSHGYMSRPIFIHRATFDAWPQDLQTAMREGVREAVTAQRTMHDQAEIEAQRIIREAGGEIIELTDEERAAFVARVEPAYTDARSRYDPALLALVGL